MFFLHGTYYLGIGMGLFSTARTIWVLVWVMFFLHGTYYLGIGMAHVFFSMARTIWVLVWLMFFSMARTIWVLVWLMFFLHTYYLGIAMGHVFSPWHILFGNNGMAHVFFSIGNGNKYN